MDGNMKEYTRLYMYNYLLYCGTLKSQKKIEYLTEKWNYDAAKEIILWNIKMNTHSFNMLFQ